MSLAVGDVLTRQADGRRFKLVGIDGDGRWIGQCLDAFQAPQLLTSDLLRDGFDADNTAAPSPTLEADLLRDRDIRATNETVRSYGRAFASSEPKSDAPSAPPQGSPEAIFAEAEKPTRTRKPREDTYDPKRLGPSGK